MKIVYLVLFILIDLIYAKINIDILVGFNASDVSINHSGIEMKIVDDHEIRLFGLADRHLREAVEKHYARRPSNVYLKSPTPWGDLYETYNWEQVSRLLSVKTASLKGITKKPVVVMSHDFENYSNTTIKVNTGISQTVENTVTTSWSRNKEITVSQELEYDVNLIFGKVTGTTGFSYTTSFEQSEERSESITIGSTSAVETELKPGQAATAVLSASRGFVEVEVVYAAKLRGNVAVNFKRPYKGHHFWGPSIEKIMESGGITNEINAVEMIKVGFYTDATLKVYDKVTGLPL